MTARDLWHTLGAWRARRRARRQEQRRQARKQQPVLWGGPVEAGRVLAFSDAIFAIAITLLTINLEVPPRLHGAAFTTALHQLLPALGAYALSFLILGQLWLAHHRRQWRKYGFGPWSAIDRRTGRWLGELGLNERPDWPGPHKVEVGWELHPSAWRRGLAAEGDRAALRMGSR